METTNKSMMTRQRIIDVSARLFLEKGFDKTTMRDIVEKLNMSKGAIYHHFKSKEEIMEAVNQMQEDEIQNQIQMLKDDLKDKDGKEKIRATLRHSVENQYDENLDGAVPELMKSAEYILKYMKNNVTKNAPIIAEMIKEGNQDGSLSCEYEEEAAEAMLLLLNIWCDPTIFQADKAKVQRKLKFIQACMKASGIDVLEDEVIRKLTSLV